MTATQIFQTAREMTHIKLSIDSLIDSLSSLPLNEKRDAYKRIHTEIYLLHDYFIQLELEGYIAYWDEVQNCYFIVPN